MFQAYLPMIKAVTQIAAGLGVSKIATDIVQNNVVIATPLQNVTVKIGTFVLGSMLWEQSSDHIERQVNNLTELIKKHAPEDSTE